MSVQLVVAGHQINIPDWIGTCARCHRDIQRQNTTIGGKVDDNGVEAVYKCPSCDRYFIASYTWTSRQNNVAVFEKMVFEEPVASSFGPIETISPLFNKIYNQASAAESHGLDEIAGIGYRKSLEFLIKDYCIYKDSKRADAIKASFLGNVIKENLEEGRIKEAAKRTVWLGNDESHYERKWEGKDLTDLKNLLRLTITGVQEALEFDAYIKEMPDPKATKPVPEQPTEATPES